MLDSCVQTLAYQKLLASKSLTNRDEVQDLLRIVRCFLATFDSPDLSQYGMLRRSRETTRLEFKPGIIEIGPNYVGINPLYGYNARERSLHMLTRILPPRLSRCDYWWTAESAFRNLLVAFLSQFLAIFVPI